MHLAENEWPTAANVRDKYWLYVVTHCAAELRFLEARQTVARGVNAALVVLYWNIGQRIRWDILKEKRAEYGEQIVAALGRQLEREFGRGYGEKNLRRMIQFAAVFPDEKQVDAGSGVPRSVSAGFPRVEEHLRGEGFGGGDFA
jgi:hypothetical protein